MLDNKTDHKHTSKLKRILQCNKSNVSPLPQTGDKAVQKISPPVLQHSTSIYSLASPTRTSFEIKNSRHYKEETPYYEIFQPLSPPPPPSSRAYGRNTDRALTRQQQLAKNPLSLHCTTRTSSSVAPTINSTSAKNNTATPRGRRSHSLHHTSHPAPTLMNQNLSPTPSMPLKSKITPAIEMSITNTNHSTKITNNKSATSISTCDTIDNDDDKSLRRHSCSSTVHYQRRHRSRMQQEASQLPLPTSPAPIPSPSPAAVAVAAAVASCSSSTSLSSASASFSSSTSSTSSCDKQHLQEQQHDHQLHHQRHHGPAILSLEKSRSTPLRPHSKIKTYNVAPPSPASRHHRSSPSSPSTVTAMQGGKKQLQRSGSDTTLPSVSRLERDLEKKRRQQELEDLISGRRGSTLKLSLTPKNSLLN